MKTNGSCEIQVYRDERKGLPDEINPKGLLRQMVRTVESLMISAVSGTCRSDRGS